MVEAWSYILASLLLGIFLYGLRPIKWWRLRHIPGPRGWWLLGSIPEVLKVGIAQLNVDLATKYGPVFKVGYAKYVVVAVADAHMAREVLRHSPIRPPWWPVAQLSPAFENGMTQSLVLANGPLWKSLRPAWQPVFFTGSLENTLEMMDAAAVRLCQQVAKVCRQGPLDVHHLSTRMAFDVITAASLGWNAPSQAQMPKSSDASRTVGQGQGKHGHHATSDIHGRSAEERWEGLTQDAVTFFLSGTGSVWVVLWMLFPALKPLLRVMRRILPEPLLESIIAARQRLEDAVAASLGSHQSGSLTAEHPDKGGLRKGVAPGAFPSLLAHTLDPTGLRTLSEEVRIQQGVVMVLAGTETSSSTIANACYLLAHSDNSAAQATLLAEIDAAGAAGGEMGAGVPPHHVLQLPYLDAVIKETLRVLPPAHVTARVAPREMNVGGYTIPKGQWVMIPIYAIHRDPHLWGPTAGSFFPERWLEAEQSPDRLKRQAVGFMPFGDGPRACPGSKFAIQEAKLALFRLLQKCTLALAYPDEPLKMRTSSTMAPSAGVWLNVHPRTQI